MPVAKTKSAQTIFTNIFDANNGMSWIWEDANFWAAKAAQVGELVQVTYQRDKEIQNMIAEYVQLLFIISIYLLIPLVSL